MKKYILLSILLISVLLTGCIPQNPWSVTVHNAQFRTLLSSTYSTYAPDPGYTWLVLNVSVGNRSKVEMSLNPFLDSFYVIGSNGNTYSWQEHYSSIIGELPRFLPPQETRRGDIYFHVPVGFDVRSAKLLFDPYNKPNITINLSGLPIS